ncbi:MAG: hybrid sensor histidine kinase/response regulator [Comamonadaceae bacterium]|nr:MAG: hybrid sensor histidine kinase/response regulator [Comamonadaceae bacterium]
MRSTGTILALSVALALWLACLTVVALLLWNARQSESQEAELRGAATTALLQAHTANTFRAVDNALVEVERALEREVLPRHDKRLRDGMRLRLAEMPYVRAIFVIGPDGRIQHDTDYPRTPDVSLADRPYFQQYLQSDDGSPVSAPIQSRSGTGWFVAVTRRIGEGADFRGVAVAAIQLTYFADLYKEVGLGRGTRIFLFHRDGRLIAHFPESSGRIGESYTELPLFRQHLPRAAWGSYLTDDGPAPFPRVVTYAAVPGFPLVVAKAHNMQASFDAWRRWVYLSGIALALLLVAMLYGVGQHLRAKALRRHREERRVQSEKMEAIGQLTGSLAHDFANVLGIVATNIGLIEKLNGDERVARAVDRAKRALDSGTGITKQLMTFSRKRDLQVADLDANEAVAAVLPLLEHAAGTQCKLVFEPGQHLPPCRIDRAQLEIALINLVVNARHAIEGQGRISIRTGNVSGEHLHPLAKLRGQKFVCVSVTDNGKGMPEAVRRRAVEPFFTTKGEEGTGFGLAQVYGFMQQIGGELTIESQVGAGTTVHLCFLASSGGAGSPGHHREDAS